MSVRGILDFFEDRLILFDAHGHQLIAPIILVKNITRLLFQFLHVRSSVNTIYFRGGIPNEHLSQFDEIAVFFIVYFNYSPGVFPGSDDPAVTGLDGGIGPDDCKRHFRHDLPVFRDCFVVIEFIAWGFKDLDLVMFDITQHSFLERDDFVAGKRISFGDNWDQIDLPSVQQDNGYRPLSGVSS